MSDPVTELDALLLGLSDDDDIMLIGEADGLLAGSLIWHDPMPFDEILPLIWGGGAFLGDAATGERIVELATYRRNSVAVELWRGGGYYLPVFDIDPINDSVVWEMWADGFGRAVDMRPAAWRELRSASDLTTRSAARDLAALVTVATTPRYRGHADLADNASELIPKLVEILYRRQRGLMLI